MRTRSASPASTDDVLALLEVSVTSTAVGAAMELGLFWLLDSSPMDELGVASELGIPPKRCYYWLQLLGAAGLVEHTTDGYCLTAIAKSAILEVYSHDAWALLAAEARERLPTLSDLPRHLRQSGSVWDALALERPDYLDQMRRDASRARQFTRMLFEVHEELAEQLAGFLSLAGASRLMDLGGGSGVISLALLRRYPELRATVIDIENVCAAGREIASKTSQADRITYKPIDFVQDELPGNFDFVLECDVNIYSESLFRRIRQALNPRGRFVIVDQLAPAPGVAPPTRLHWAFEGSLANADYAFPTAEQLLQLLTRAGFKDFTQAELPAVPDSCWRMTGDTTVIEARK